MVHFVDIVLFSFVEGLQALGGISFLFLVKFLVECRQNHVWGPIFVPSYDHIYKNIHFCKGKGREAREGKGRESGKGKREGKREGKKGREKGKGSPLCFAVMASAHA